jgi:hypothetical protein
MSTRQRFVVDDADHTARRANCALVVSILVMILFIIATVLSIVAYTKALDNAERIVVLEAFHSITR